MACFMVFPVANSIRRKDVSKITRGVTMTTGVAVVGTCCRSLSVMSSPKKPSVPGKTKRKLADISTDAVESDPLSPSSSSDSASVSSASNSGSELDSGSEAEDASVREAEAVTDEPDEPVLSHAEKRRQKRRKLNSGDAAPADVSESPIKAAPASSDPKRGKRKGEELEIAGSGDALPKRQNSVWVGNLAYKTTSVTLKAFFEGLEVTRIHMPMKAPQSGTGPKVNSGSVIHLYYALSPFSRWLVFG